MARQTHIPGLEQLQLNGIAYSWNATMGEYWSESGDPRVLQSEDIQAWLLAFNTKRPYSPEGQKIEAKIIAQDVCPVTDRPLFCPLSGPHSRHLRRCARVGGYRRRPDDRV